MTNLLTTKQACIFLREAGIDIDERKLRRMAQTKKIGARKNWSEDINGLRVKPATNEWRFHKLELECYVREQCVVEPETDWSREIIFAIIAVLLFIIYRLVSF